MLETSFDGEAFGKEMVDIVRSYMEAELKPLHEELTATKAANEGLAQRVAELEARELPEAIKGEPGEKGEPGADGVVDMDAVKQLIDEAVSAIPPAEKGEPGEPGKDGAPGEKGEPGKDGADGEPGKDGVGLSDALKNQDGHLVLVMADGRTKDLGKIDGEPGRDGLGFDDLRVEQIGERTVRFVLERGQDEAEFDVTFPVPVYRDVWQEKGEYERGDMTTWAGCLWHCDEPKGMKPGAPDSGWVLVAKRGRDGKDAK